MTKLMDIKIDSLYFPGAKDPVLKDIDLVISSGEFIVLAGSSGAGKSLLLHCLAGVIPLHQPARLSGEIRFRGQSITRLPEAAGKIGLVTDNPQNQLFCTTVAEDLNFGPCSMLLDQSEIHLRREAALDFVGLSGYGERKPETLSGGEMQRVVLASVWSMHPEVLLLDRPADQLDAKGRKEIYRKLHTLCKESGKTVIITEEMLEEVIPWADRIWMMDRGTLVSDLPAGPALTPAAIRGKYRPEKSSPFVPSRTPQPVKTVSVFSPAIEVKDVSLCYEENGFALHNITLKIAPGEFVALMGENGAGKTTLTKTFNGLLRPQAGSVHINGLDTRQHTTAQLSGQVGYLFQDPLMQVCQSSVEEEIAFALKVRKYPKGQIKEKVRQVIQDFHLEAVASLHPYRLSRGMLQKAALASALVTDPPILVMDEPTSQMGYEEAWEVLELIDRYHQTGRTVVMITHHMQFALEFCRRFIVLKKGRLLLDTDQAALSQYGEVFYDLGINPKEIPGLGGKQNEIVFGL